MNEDDDPLLKMGTGGLSVGVAVRLASAAPAVSRAVGVGSETPRTEGFPLLGVAAVVIRTRWTPSA